VFTIYIKRETSSEQEMIWDDDKLRLTIKDDDKEEGEGNSDSNQDI